MLAIENEGIRVARYLADHGVAAFVLKYRTIPVPRDRRQYYEAMGKIMAGPPDESKPLAATREVLAQHRPMIVASPRLQSMRSMTLRQIQSYSPEQMSDAVLGRVDADLAKLPQ